MIRGRQTECACYSGQLSQLFRTIPQGSKQQGNCSKIETKGPEQLGQLSFLTPIRLPPPKRRPSAAECLSQNDLTVKMYARSVDRPRFCV